MALRKIARMGEPILRKVAAPVARERIGTPAFEQLIEDMIETMYDAEGAGLAAPQIYESLQLCVIELRDNPRYPGLPVIPLTVLINPTLEPLVSSPDGPADSEAIAVYEGCLSVPGVRGRVRRPRKVRVRGLDRAGSPVDQIWEGFHAAVVQHETDHLFGRLFVDRADPKTLTFLTEYERYIPASQRFWDGGVIGRSPAPGGDSK
jgi:peptide deformylase